MNCFIAHIENAAALLTPEESWHCAKVLRYKPGQAIRVIDGIGNFYEAQLSEVSPKQCVAQITSGPHKQAERNYQLHLAIAPTKNNDRTEWLVEKAVELGVDELSFVLCKNSERRVLKTERIKGIVESAVKQSLQATIPKVNELTELTTFIKNTPSKQKLIAHCFDTPKTPIQLIDFEHTNSLVLIGPEGDFTTQEVETAINGGYQPISLGTNRLRTETAGLYVCQAASLLCAAKKNR